MHKITYRPEIDGLRALSVLAVILFHFSAKLLPGGFMGVDVFFVISGYLITSIIIESHQSGQPWLGSFWVRRLRRIFPALAVMVILVLLFVILIGLPCLVTSTGKQALSVSAFLANFRLLAIAGDYWGPSADYTVLLHTWSLAVEEQFYFIYPILLAGILSYFTTKSLGRFLAVFFLVSWWWCIRQTDNSQAQAFYLLPSRAWELTAGAIIALKGKEIYEWVSIKTAQILASVGLGIILFSLFVLPGDHLFPGKIAIIPVVGAVLFILFSPAGGFSSRVLSTSPALFIGRASYSLYLWHWPMLVLGFFFAEFFEFEAFRTIGILLGISLGFASYLWIEPLGKNPRFLKLYAPLAALLMILLSAFASKGWLNLYPERFQRDAIGYKFDVRIKPKVSFWKRALRSVIKPNETRLKTLEEAGIAETKIDVMLIGDSHAIALANNIDTYVKSQGLKNFVYASSGMPLAPVSTSSLLKNQSNKEFYEMRLKLIKDLSPKVIIIVSRWEDVKSSEELGEVENLLKNIHLLNPKGVIIVLGQPPVIDYARRARIGTHEWINWRYRMRAGLTTFPIYISPFTEKAHLYIKNIATENKHIKFIPTSDLFSVNNGRINALSDGKLLYDDGNHLSESGSKLVTNKIAPIILEVLNK
jgi:peptidoglycan/LPS O-acetylase OafA/YrhL